MCSDIRPGEATATCEYMISLMHGLHWGRVLRRLHDFPWHLVLPFWRSTISLNRYSLLYFLKIRTQYVHNYAKLLERVTLITFPVFNICVNNAMAVNAVLHNTCMFMMKCQQESDSPHKYQMEGKCCGKHDLQQAETKKCWLLPQWASHIWRVLYSTLWVKQHNVENGHQNTLYIAIFSKINVLMYFKKFWVQDTTTETPIKTHIFSQISSMSDIWLHNTA